MKSGYMVGKCGRYRVRCVRGYIVTDRLIELGVVSCWVHGCRLRIYSIFKTYFSSP